MIFLNTGAVENFDYVVVVGCVAMAVIYLFCRFIGFAWKICFGKRVPCADEQPDE